MGGELATVLVRLTADASDFIETIGKADASLRDLAVGAAAMTAAGVAIGAALTGATEYASKYETEIFNLSQRTGVATETLSALRVAADAQGKSLDSVQVAFRQLGREAENASLGQKKAIESFEAIGVSVKDSSGRMKELSELFPEVNEGLSKVGNSAIQVGLANDLYGRSSLALLPVLGGGIDKLNQFGQVATETGVMVTQSQAEQGKAFQLMQMIAEDSIKGLAIALGSVLMPALEGVIDSMKSSVEWVSALVREYPELTAAVAALAVGLTGAGGLLLGITGVVAAFNLLTSTVGTMAGGLVVFAGAVGVLSSLAYVFRNDLAEIITAIGSRLSGALAAVIGPIATLAGKAGLGGLHDSLMDVKFSLEQNAIDWKDQSEQFSHVVSAANPLDERLKALMASLRGTGDAHLDGVPKISAFQSAVNRLVDSVTEEIKAGPVLVAALGAMTLAHENEESIVMKLGPKIVAYHDELVRGGHVVDALTQYYFDLAVARDTDVLNTERQFDLAVKLGKIFEDNKVTMRQLATEHAVARATMDIADKQYLAALNVSIAGENDAIKELYRDELSEKIKATNDALANDQTYNRKSLDLALATSEYKTLADEAYWRIRLDAETLDLMNNGAFSELEVKQQKEKLDQELAAWRAYNNEYIKLDDETTATVRRYHDSFYISEDEARQNMELAMAHTMAAISTNIASAIADDIVHWKNFGDSIVKIAQDAADQMLKAFLTGLLNPLTNLMTSVGKGISNSLSGLITGGGGGAGGSLFGIAEGGGAGLLAGLFGGGAATAFGGSVAAGGYTAASAGMLMGTSTGVAGAGAGGGLMSSLGALMTNPWTIGIAGAIAATYALFEVWKNQAHHQADAYGTELVEPFDNQLAKLVDAQNAAAASGMETKEQAETALAAVTDLWTTFQQQSSKFAAEGKNQALVVQQHFQDLGPLMTNILDKMKGQVNDLADATTNSLVKALKEVPPTAAAAAAAFKTVFGPVEEVIHRLVGVMKPIQEQPQPKGGSGQQSFKLMQHWEDMDTIFGVSRELVTDPDGWNPSMGAVLPGYHLEPSIKPTTTSFAAGDAAAGSHGSGNEIVSLLTRILDALVAGGSIDGKNLARALAPSFYYITKFEGAQIMGDR